MILACPYPDCEMPQTTERLKLGHPTDLTCEDCSRGFEATVEKDEDGHVDVTCALLDPVEEET